MQMQIVAPIGYGALTQKVLDRTKSYPKTKHIMKTEYGVELILKEMHE